MEHVNYLRMHCTSSFVDYHVLNAPSCLSFLIIRRVICCLSLSCFNPFSPLCFLQGGENTFSCLPHTSLQNISSPYLFITMLLSLHAFMPLLLPPPFTLESYPPFIIHLCLPLFVLFLLHPSIIPLLSSGVFVFLF